MSWDNTVSLGGIALDLETVEEFRLAESVQGWDDTPAISSGLQVKDQQDGAWDGTGTLRERVVQVNGYYEASTAQAAAAFKDQLTGLEPQQTYLFQVANIHTGTRSAMARVTVGAVVQWLVDAYKFGYTITLSMPDPRKYGPVVFASTDLSGQAGTGLVYPLAYPLDYGVAAGQTPGAIAVDNAGSVAYWPRLRIDGPVPNPVVTLNETGDWFRFNGTVKAGQWLDVDLASRRVLLNGQVSVRQLVTSHGAWLQVPKGGGSISWEADAADPAARLSVWSYEGAWL